MNYWTIMRIPSEVLEGSEQHELLTVGGTHKVPFPTPRVFQEKAYVFCDYLPDAAEPLTVELTFDAEGKPIKTVADIAAQIDAYLKGNDKRCVWLSQDLASQIDKLFPPTEEEAP
jgi:hypothetical protein